MAKVYENAGIQITDVDAPLIARLSAHHQEALTWVGTDAAVADAQNIPIGTVKSRRNRARNALRAARHANPQET